jgi:hypothetical protein
LYAVFTNYLLVAYLKTEIIIVYEHPLPIEGSHVSSTGRKRRRRDQKRGHTPTSTA